jgi:hypothetical protein
MTMSRDASPQAVRRRRIFIGLIEVAGYYANLREGFEGNGHSVTFVTAGDHVFNYEVRSPRWIERITAAWVRKEWEMEPWGVWERAPAWVRDAARWLLVTWLGLTHDWFIFSAARSFETNGHAMVRRLRRMGRKVVFICNGSESRARFVDGTGYAERDETPVLANRLARETRAVRDNLHELHQSATFIVDNPVSAHFHPGPFVNWYSVGIPTRIDGVGEAAPRTGDVIRVLHSPSYPRMKGSAEVRRVVNKLKEEGWKLEYIELTGVPNSEVLRQISECDMVIDQLFSDQPMAGFAREAALFGKPAIVAGYGFWVHASATVLAAEWAPTVTCRPQEFEATLRSFLERGRTEWERVGAQARAFVLRQWSARDCASRLGEALENGPRKEWWVDPLRMNYLWGCGQSAMQMREMIATLLATHGESALCLDDKPHLLRQYLELAKPVMDQAESITGDADKISLDESSPSEAAAFDPVARNVRLQQRLKELEDAAQELVKFTPEEWSKLGLELSSVVNRLGMLRRRDEKIAKLTAKLEKLQSKR